MGQGMMGGGPGMMGGGFLFMLLLLIGAVILVVWIVKMMSPQQGDTETTSREDAVEIARKRYAKGEISKEEFEQIKRELQ